MEWKHDDPSIQHPARHWPFRREYDDLRRSVYQQTKNQALTLLQGLIEYEQSAQFEGIGTNHAERIELIEFCMTGIRQMKQSEP